MRAHFLRTADALAGILLAVTAGFGCGRDDGTTVATTPPPVMQPVGAGATAAGTGATSGTAGKAGAGGSAAGGAGSGGGTAGSTAGAAAPNTTGCGPATSASPADLHAAAAAVLLPTATNRCAFSSCHNEASSKAGLALENKMLDLRVTLVGKTACESPNLVLIADGGSDAALAKSWLWLKLTAPADAATGAITPNTAWGTSGSCGQLSASAGYGMRMPLGTPDGLSADKLAAVRDWICGGAPGLK
jgi:hypothetical protein